MTNVIDGRSPITVDYYELLIGLAKNYWLVDRQVGWATIDRGENGGGGRIDHHLAVTNNKRQNQNCVDRFTERDKMA